MHWTTCQQVVGKSVAKRKFAHVVAFALSDEWGDLGRGEIRRPHMTPLKRLTVILRTPQMSFLCFSFVCPHPHSLGGWQVLCPRGTMAEEGGWLQMGKRVEQGVPWFSFFVQVQSVSLRAPSL